MNMFRKYIDRLPPFKKYWDEMFEKKQMIVLALESGARVLQFKELRKKLFNLCDPTNAATSKQLVQLAKVAAQAILNELHDQKKAAWKCLSISGSTHSYQGCPHEVQKEIFGHEVTNDRRESAVVGTTHQLQKYGRIGITNAAAVSDAKTNGFFRQFASNDSKMKGMFYQFEQKMHECSLTVTKEDAPETISVSREELDKQRKTKRK
jgi:hypothetical protein